MLGLSLGREYRDRINSGPVIPSRTVTDSEGESCATPTYGFHFEDMSSSYVTTSLGGTGTVVISEVGGHSSCDLNIGNKDIDSVSVLPEFKGKENVLKVEFGGVSPGDRLSAKRINARIFSSIKDSSGNDVLYSTVLHPDWSHHVVAKFWVDINPNNDPNNEIPVSEAGSTKGYGFGGTILESLAHFKPNSEISRSLNQWVEIKLDIFDQEYGPGAPMLSDGSNNSDGPSSSYIGNIHYNSDSYPPGWPNPGGYFGASAFYLAEVKYVICPRT